MSATIDEQELRSLLGGLVGELGERFGKMNTFDLVEAVRPRVAARALALGCAPPSDDFLRQVANRWLSEYAVAEATRLIEEEEDPA